MQRKLVIFDMDGTLTEPLLDFDAIRRELGLPEKAPIIEGIAAMDADRRAAGERILDRHEMAAAGKCVLMPGAKATLAALHSRGVRAALLTRNSRACAETVLRRHSLNFCHVATRENGPHKPHPGSIFNILRACGVQAAEAVMVGDYLFDLQAAAGAGVDSVLLLAPEKKPQWAYSATWRIARLPELLPLIGIHGAAAAAGK